MNTFKCSVASACAGFVGACAIAGYMLKRRGIKDDGAKPFSLTGGPTVHILACAMIVWLLTSITCNEWMKVGLVATVIFAVTRRGRFVEETS
jgi:peptidoglycan biosynthesis protein MviN/MurJ (putative lipid II flippase)